MNESFKRYFPSASVPLPTHNPLQLLHWKDQERQHNTWYLEKYNRLQDSRKQPLSVDCGPDDRLIIQFKEQVNKMICIYHNYRELETFCIHPLLFSHDLISKETRLLFCIKDQIDGSIRYKFRVKFVSQDEVISFCSAVAGYVTIKSYEEWSKQSEGARTPTFSERGRTPMSEKGNITPLEQTFDTTIVNETDASESVSANRAPAEDKTGTNGQNIINVHIENLISVEAMREFGNILLQIVDKCISSNKKERNKKTQMQQEGPNIQSTSTIQPALPSTTKLTAKRGRKPNPDNNENKPVAKKRRDMNPSKWRIYDFERQLLQMVKEEKAEIHRARTPGTKYNLRGISDEIE